jgi:hypothetical protein
MPVSHTKLRAPQKSYTKQDYLDGKCTKDGLPLDGASNEPDQTPTPSPEPVFDTGTEETTTTGVNEGTYATVDTTVDDNPEVVEENVNDDSTDSEESEDNADRGESPGEETDREAT